MKEFYEGGTTTNAAANGGKINPRYCTDSWPQKVNLQGAFNPLTPVVAVTAWTIFVFSSMYQFYYFRWIVVLYYFTCMVMSLRSGYGFDKLELSINGVTAPKCFKTKQEQQVQSKPSSTAGTGTAPNKNNSKTKNGSSENSRLL